MELRLLTDPSFTEEFDTIVDEITDEYVAGEFKGEERERVEQYFLRSAERHEKVKFASSLVRRASLERGGKKTVKSPDEPPPGALFEQARTFWLNQGLALRVVIGTASVVIVAGLILLILPSSTSPPTFASLTLPISNTTRGEGKAKPETARLAPGVVELRLSLKLPDQRPQSRASRVELLNEEGARRSLSIAEQDPQFVRVVVPTSDLPRGNYALKLFLVTPDGTEQPLNGSYLFDVE